MSIDITVDRICPTCKVVIPLRFSTGLVTMNERSIFDVQIDPDEFTACQSCGKPLHLRLRAQPYDLANHLDTPIARAIYEEQQLRGEQDNAY